MSQESIRHQTLIVSRNWAKCGKCGKGADLHDKRHLHLTAVSYVLPKPDEKPCGVEWKYLASDFADLQGEFEKRVRAMRPDLEWVGLVNW